MPLLLELDGGYGSGGGQVLRTSLALSALLGKPFRIKNIRARRPNPGLRPQHLTCVHALAEVSDARVNGAFVGSRELLFEPCEMKSGRYSFDSKTAGSVTLILQPLFPALAFAQTQSFVKVMGGTMVPFSPPTSFLQEVFLPVAAKTGLHAKVGVKRLGWYPKGGGVVEAGVEPAKSFSAIQLIERGALKELRGEIVFSNLPQAICDRMKAYALKVLSEKGFEAKIVSSNEPAAGPGICFFLQAVYENSVAGFSALGEKGKPSEEVVGEALAEFLEFHESNACIDKHLGDQLIPFAALAKGLSRLRAFLTPHLLTNSWVCEQFLETKFVLDGKTNEVGTIFVKGIGFENKFI